MTKKGNFHELYVATEEEVTTIISRVHAVKERYVVLIIPKNALLLQSTINLRLLSRESKKQQKEIVIITQDEFGLKLAERLGIHAESLSVWQKEMSNQENISKETFEIEDEIIKEEDDFQDKKIGSNGYYSEENSKIKKSKTFSDIQPSKVTNKDDDSKIFIDENSSDRKAYNSKQIRPLIEKNVSRTSFSEEEIKKELCKKDKYDKEIIKQSFFENEYKEIEQKKFKDECDIKKTKNTRIFSKLAKQVDKFNLISDKKNVDDKFKKKIKLKAKSKNVRVKSPYKKIVFISICIIFSILFITTFPYSKIILEISDFVISDKVTITASVDEQKMDFDRRIIVARKIEKDITRKISISPTGERDTTPQKAKGTITIYNEFSSKAQPLVKTTRFLAEDGTLFRLVKNVSVPGLTRKGDKSIPGELDVLVVADKAGKTSNIKATKFSIPGFKGTGKEDKIYAVSEKSMIGGSSGVDNYSTVEENDIVEAKNKAEKDINKYVLSEVQKLLKPDEEILLGDAIKLEITRSEADSVVGSAVDKVVYFVTTHVIAVIVNENDIEKIAKYALRQKSSKFTENDMEFKYSFEKVDADFDDGRLIIGVDASAKKEGIVDEDEFKRDILSKTHYELSKIVKEKYPVVTDISVVPFPSFPSFLSDRISARTWMTKIINK